LRLQLWSEYCKIAFDRIPPSVYEVLVRQWFLSRTVTFSMREHLLHFLRRALSKQELRAGFLGVRHLSD
jgi:hypothetical protein